MRQRMIHLHCHSDGSNLRLIDCINKIPQLIDRAVELGNPGIAVTDHESLSNHIKALKYVNAGKKNGTIPEEFKLILGNEIYLVNSISDVKDGYIPGKTKYWHFILLALDEVGHRQLRELSSIAWGNYFRTGGMERVPLTKEELESIIGDDKGHLLGSTACLGGEFACDVLDDQMEDAIQFVKWGVNTFGEGYFLLEMQPSDSEEQIKVNQTIVELSKKYNLPFIITCDAHYLRKEDRVYHAAYLNSHDEEREVDTFYQTTYMMSIEEIHDYMDKYIGKELSLIHI